MHSKTCDMIDTLDCFLEVRSSEALNRVSSL